MQHWIDTNKWLIWVLLAGTYAVHFYRIKMISKQKLTIPEKMMIEKALRFYEDVACCIAPHSTKLEELSDDLRTIDKIKEKIK